MAINILDFKTDLRVASDFILSTNLCRKALEASLPGGAANIIRDVLKVVDILVQSCHLPEFTDHGIPHLVSLVDRADQWTVGDDKFLVELLNPDEATLLILAILTHDLGMLSQDPLDMETAQSTKGMSNVANWVRKTHCKRLRRLLKRILEAEGYTKFAQSKFFDLLCYISMAHEEWSWQKESQHYPNIRKMVPYMSADGYKISADRACGIAAVVAVCDILDEDSLRCDTETLLLHRQGNVLNKAHWIRHLLTKERVYIKKNKFTVTFRWLQYGTDQRGIQILNDPSGCQSGSRHKNAIDALKNQFSSTLLYNDDLSALKADLGDPTYNEEDEMVSIPWNLPSLRDFWDCTPERLLQSVFSFAREPNADVRKKWGKITGNATFRTLDLVNYYRLIGLSDDRPEPLSDEEITFRSIFEANL
ncbi:MAG: hypothetical protein NT178_18390 [Proteobacteria bacterium]|nr:hypothetical protein [Pseudomonadota bacterium]